MDGHRGRRTVRPGRVVPVAVATALALLAGCADGAERPGAEGTATATAPTTAAPSGTGTEPSPTPTSSASAADVATSLTVTLDETGSGASRTLTLTCDPVGGDHPEAAAACATLATVGTEAFEPPPVGVMCTQQWGGPQVATVEGTVAGLPVSARFSRTDGCEISRWDALTPLLPAAEGA